MPQHDPDYQSRRFVLTVVLMIAMGLLVIGSLLLVLLPHLMRILGRGGVSL